MKLWNTYIASYVNILHRVGEPWSNFLRLQVGVIYHFPKYCAHLTHFDVHCLDLEVVIYSYTWLTIIRRRWQDATGLFNRYVEWQVAHVPGMPRTFSPPPTSKETAVGDPGMHPGTFVTHVPWLMSGSLTRGVGKNVPDIPGACATHNFAYLARGPCYLVMHHTQQSFLT